MLLERRSVATMSVTDHLSLIEEGCTVRQPVDNPVTCERVVYWFQRNLLPQPFAINDRKKIAVKRESEILQCLFSDSIWRTCLLPMRSRLFSERVSSSRNHLGTIVNRRPKRTPYRRAKGTPFVEQRNGYDGRTVRAGCGVGRA